MHGYRRFCNKIYQATKFVLGKLETDFVPQSTSTKSGKESLAERWILHKLTIAAKEINQALTDREFSTATSVSYQFWYTQLCDVYIENSKAIIQDGTPEEKVSAKNTLYTALDGALTMIHPFMPFLTEELWQRLPRRPEDSTPSIVLAKYPVYEASLDDPASESAYELILGVSKGIRSLMAEYNIRDDGQLWIQLFNNTAHASCTAELASICSLSGKGVGEIAIISAKDPKPAGCVPFAVNAEATVFLLVKGRVDIDEEISKAKKKLERASELVKKQKGILADEGYKAKVGEELQEVERRKLRDAEAEVGEMEESVKQFELLKLD
jgi:valyl-tRNA synthetase